MVAALKLRLRTTSQSTYSDQVEAGFYVYRADSCRDFGSLDMTVAESNPYMTREPLCRFATIGPSADLTLGGLPQHKDGLRLHDSTTRSVCVSINQCHISTDNRLTSRDTTFSAPNFLSFRSVNVSGRD